jgi:hypothetical protein
VAESVEEVSEPSAEDEETKDEESPSITELLVLLGSNISVLGFCETHLLVARNLPEARRAARDVAGALIAALAFLTAFVFANVAALHGLASVMSVWLAALVLCVVWIAVGSALTLALMIRAGHMTGWKWWRVFSSGPEGSLEDLERARDDAEQAIRDTLMQLAPAVTVEIASASVAVAGDMADGVVDAGSDLLETSDEIVEAIADDIPGGSVVSQMWDVVLIPGRFGVKVATTVLRRDGPEA